MAFTKNFDNLDENEVEMIPLEQNGQPLGQQEIPIENETNE